MAKWVVGTTNPTRKLHVNGSIQIADTVYAGAIKPSLMSAANLPDEPGVASAKAANAGGIVSLSHTWQTLVSRQITVPGPGYVVALGHAYFSYDHTYTDYDAVHIGISDVTTDVPLSRITSFGTSYDVGTGLYSGSLSPSALFEVAGAGSYTYYLLGMKYDAVSAPVIGAELILLYVPTAYGTVSPLAAGEVANGSVGELLKQREPRTTTSTAPQTNYAEELRILRERVEQLEKQVEGAQR